MPSGRGGAPGGGRAAGRTPEAASADARARAHPIRSPRPGTRGVFGENPRTAVRARSLRCRPGLCRRPTGRRRASGLSRAVLSRLGGSVCLNGQSCTQAPRPSFCSVPGRTVRSQEIPDRNICPSLPQMSGVPVLAREPTLAVGPGRRLFRGAPARRPALL